LRQPLALIQVKIVAGNWSRITSAKAARALAAKFVPWGGEIGFKPELQVGAPYQLKSWPDSQFPAPARKRKKGRRELLVDPLVSSLVARPERFELPTTKFVAWCSIQLSYGRAER